MSSAVAGRRQRKLGVRAPLVAAVMLALGSGVAFAQSVTGGMYGQALAGETVQIQATNSGVERTVVPNKHGRFSITALNPGSYKVEVLRAGQVVSTSVVVVRPGLMSPVPNAVAAKATSSNASTLAAIQVTGNTLGARKFDINPIDVSTPQLISHYSMKLVNDLPTGRSPESIALLKSSVTYDSQTTGSVELNGATAAENRYYLNGFDVTNNRTNIGSFTFPAEAIQSTDVIDGNFDASWSNTTGGNMASTVRQGGNKPEAGYSLYFTPPTSRLLRPRGDETVNSIGRLYTYNTPADHSAPGITQYFWGSGALVKNKLFAFAMFGQSLPRTSTNYGCCSASTSSGRDRNELLNLTWDITNNQTFDVLAAHDSSSSFSTSYRLDKLYDPSSRGDSTGWSNPANFTRYLIGDYEWQVSDNFSMHLMMGYSNLINGGVSSGNLATGQPYVASVDPTTQITTVIGPTSQYFVFFPSHTTEHGYKADFDWWLGNNKIQFGAEYYRDMQSIHWQTSSGGNYTYYDQPGTVLPNGSTVSSTDGRYVQLYFDDEFARVRMHRKSAYIQDSWQATDRVMLYGGVRWDSNTYTDGIGRPFMTLPFFSPRLGFAWDVDGDSTFKVGGNVGRYSIALPANFDIGVGMAQSQYQQFFTYTGRDSDQAPTGLTQIGPTFVTNDGIPPGADQIGSRNIRAPLEYAANLYAQKVFSPAWSGLGVIGFTNLKRVVNETCEEDAVTAWAQSHGFPNYVASNEVHECYEVNPGRQVVLVRDFAGNGGLQELRIPGSALGILGPKHKYYHLTLGLEHHPTRTEPYFLDLSYTFARSFGNTDGLLDLSHRDPGYIGQTQVFDYPQMQIDADGNLADDIRNTFVASGVYYFHNGLHVGSILRMNTGAPISCLGSYPNASSPANINEGASSYFCDGEPHTRGSMRLPWMWTLGLDLGYDWKINSQNQLSVNLQIQNITNHQGVNDLNQTFDTSQMISQTQAVPSVNYLAPRLTSPRFTSLVLRYRFN